jgi:hypothetical protein
MTIQLLLASILAQTPSAVPPPSAWSSPLRDQTGELRSASDLAGEPVVVIVVALRRLRTVESWEEALQRHSPGLRTLLVADVPASDPPAEYGRIAERLTQRVPEGVRVLIDLDRLWAEEFELETSSPSLLLFDDAGGLSGTHTGRYRPGEGSDFLAAIDRLRAPG